MYFTRPSKVRTCRTRLVVQFVVSVLYHSGDFLKELICRIYAMKNLRALFGDILRR